MESSNTKQGGPDLNLSPDASLNASPITAKKEEASQNSNSRMSRFSVESQTRSTKYLTLKEKRELQKKDVEDRMKAAAPKNLTQADYKTRGLDFCYFCGEKFNVGEKIPRILIHCGHTFCTECLTQIHHNYRVRCPICRKLVKQVESVDKLPLNFNILYEIVERDFILRDINFEDESCIDCLLCEKHDQRVQHFYCSNHLTVFCRECIKEDHTDERCFVVDLYEIEKMRKMHRLNQQMNKKQLEKRKDGANQSCVNQEISADQVIGDSKWFLKRRADQIQKMQQKMQNQYKMQNSQQALLQSQTNFSMNNSGLPSDPQTLLAMYNTLLQCMNSQSMQQLPPQLALLTNEQKQQLLALGQAEQHQQLQKAAQMEQNAYTNNIDESDSDEDPYTKKRQLFEDDDCEGSGSNEDDDEDILEDQDDQDAIDDDDDISGEDHDDYVDEDDEDEDSQEDLNGNAQQEIITKMNGLSDPKPEMSERDKLKEEMKAVTSKGKTNENDKTIEK